MPPVGHHRHRILRLFQNQLQALGAELFAVLPRRLVQQNPQLAALQVDGQVARGGLGRLHQILRQLFEPCGLALEHFNVLLGLFAVDVLLGQQIHIVDNGGQRGFDVVGHVGNELSFEMLALHPLIHGPADAVADAVQVVGVVQQVAVHVFGVDGIVHVAPGDFGRPGAEPFHAGQQVHQQRQQYRPLHEPAEELGAGGILGGADKNELDQQHRRDNEGGTAQQGQAVDKGTE